MNNSHITVLRGKVSNLITFRKQRSYRVVDCTLGGGGHSLAILKRFWHQAAEKSRLTLVVADFEPRAWQLFCQGLLEQGWIAQPQFEAAVTDGATNITNEKRTVEIRFQLGNFANLSISPDTDLVIADLGPSQNQIDDNNLGLSYQKAGVLDMRLDSSLTMSAQQLLQEISLPALQDTFTHAGFPVAVATALAQQLKSAPPQTTAELRRLSEAAFATAESPKGKWGKYTALVFQTLRIMVNLEYDNLRILLANNAKMIANGGTLAVITFHSGEAKLVAETSRKRNWRSVKDYPSHAELALNARARSAILHTLTRS